MNKIVDKNTLKTYITALAIGIGIIFIDSVSHELNQFTSSRLNPNSLRTVKYIPKKLTKQDITNIDKLRKKEYFEVIKAIDTPEKAAYYVIRHIKHGGPDIDSLLYGKADYWASFKQIHKNKKDDCDGGALAAAALLSDNNYPPYILHMWKENVDGHAVYLFKDQNNKYCSIGYNHTDIILQGKDSIEKLVEELMGKEYTYKIIDLSQINPDFINNDINNRSRY